EAMRKNAAWKVFHQNVKNLHAVNARLGKPARLYGITCIPADKPLHNKWMHPEFRELYELLDWSELRRLHNWAGEISTVAVREKRHKIGCSMLMKQMVLLPNGDITVCCSDLNSKGVVGNVRQQDLVSILHSENRKRYLSLLLRRRKSQLDLCRECETF
uniref:SPASM domain-containing protein n=1 Tax=Chitinophaga sp. TaxID=1869181 RepID=UPI002624CEA6